MTNPTIEKNLQRVNKLVDAHVTKSDSGIPLFNWIEMSLVDMCNRSCVFCPRSNPDIAPNQALEISQTLIDKIADELQQINYDGTIMLAGYGEPMMSKHLLSTIEKFASVANVEITTNGDFLSEKSLIDMIAAGINMIVVSLYDGPHQVHQFNDMIVKSKIDKKKIILRDRWYTQDSDYGLKLTNRAGTIDMHESNAPARNQCFYPFYSMNIDWNGDVFLCTQDWNRRTKSGNLHSQSILSIWNSKILRRYRRLLHAGKRSSPPCVNCNAEGTLHGKSHASEWMKYYTRNIISSVDISE